MKSVTRSSATRLVILLVASVICEALGASLSYAAPVTFTFEGEVTQVVFDNNGEVTGHVTAGTPFSASFTFETTTPNSLPSDPLEAIYPDAVISTATSLGPFTLSSVPPTGGGTFGNSNRILVINRVGGATDTYELRAMVLLGDHPLLMRVGLDGNGWLTDREILLSPPDIQRLTTAQFDLIDQGSLHIQGMVTNIVPEPISLLLVASFCVILGRNRRSYSN